MHGIQVLSWRGLQNPAEECNVLIIGFPGDQKTSPIFFYKEDGAGFLLRSLRFPDHM